MALKRGVGKLKLKHALLLLVIVASFTSSFATNRFWVGNETAQSIMTKASSVTNISSYNTWYHNGSLCLWNSTAWDCISNWSGVNASGGGVGNATPAAPNQSVQFNYNDAFAGDAGFTWDNAANKLVVVGNGSFGEQLVVNGTYGNTSFTGNNILFNRPQPNYITATNAVGALLLGAGGTSGALYLQYNALANTLYLNNVGVGVKKTNPNVALDVVGDVNVSANVTSPKYCFPDTTCFNASNLTGGDYLQLSGANANQNIDVGSYNFTASALRVSNGSYSVGLTTQNGLTANSTYFLPLEDGREHQVLSTNGTGVLSWASSFGSGQTWIDPVISKSYNQDPANPVTGDRYLVGTVGGEWYDADWEYRSNLTINASALSKSWAGIGDIIIGFDFYDDHEIYSYAQSDGSDFRITDTNNDLIEAFCLERHQNATANRTTIYFREREIQNVTDTQYYLYYGNDNGVASISDCELTFMHYKSIFYAMNMTGDDLTWNGRNWAGQYGNPTLSEVETVGWGVDFDQSDGYNMQDVAYFEQAWERRYHELIFTVNETNEKQMIFGEGGGTNGVSLYIWTDGTLHAFWWSRSTGMTDIDITMDNPVVVGNTYYALMTFDATGAAGQACLYINGTLQNTTCTAADATMNAHSGNGGIGYSGSNTKRYHDNSASTGYFNGTIHYFDVGDDAEEIYITYGDYYAQDWFNSLTNTSGFWALEPAETPSTHALGNWTGYEDNVTEWNGTVWEFEAPMEGWATYVEDEETFYSWVAGDWILMTGALSHQNLNQLQGGYDSGSAPTSEYYHLNASNYTVATREATDAQSGIMPAGKMSFWDDAYAYRIEAVTTDYETATLGDARFGIIGGANTWTNATVNPLVTNNVSINLNNDIFLESAYLERNNAVPLTAIVNGTQVGTIAEIAKFVHKSSLLIASGFGGSLNFYGEGAITPETLVAQVRYEMSLTALFNSYRFIIANHRADLAILEDHLIIEPEGVTHFSNQSRARVYLDNPQMIMCGAPNLILFDMINYDEQGEMGGLNVEVFTALYDGYYDAKCGYWLDDMMFTRDVIWIDLYVNGALVTQQVHEATGDTMFTSIDTSDTLQLNAGDTVECYAECIGMMGMFNLMTTSPYTYMAIHKLS